MTDLFYLAALPPLQQNLWLLWSKQRVFLSSWGFYLAGGTSLALQAGHRESLDYDFFSQRKGSASAVISWLDSLHRPYTLRERDADTVHVELDSVFVSFIGAYRYPLVTPLVSYDGVALSSIAEIGLMKLHALQDRASLRDYLDVALIFRDHQPLASLIPLLSQKYGSKFNILLSLRALAAWEDIADEGPVTVIDPTLQETWQEVIKQELGKLAA